MLFLGMLFAQTSHKTVILSEAPHRFIARHNARKGAESKDLDGAYLAHAAWSISTTEACLLMRRGPT
jgi:hypothetical protein